jgi:hypothetical protein
LDVGSFEHLLQPRIVLGPIDLLGIYGDAKRGLTRPDALFYQLKNIVVRIENADLGPEY